MHLKTSAFEPQKTGQSISIIVPCFNESEGIKFLKAKLLPIVAQLLLTRQVELIFVDDGSTDDTFAQLQTNFSHLAQIVRHQKNQGLSAAIQTGFVHSTGQIVCTMDSDCTYDPQQLIPLLALMASNVDIVTASPYHPRGKVKGVPAWRLFLSQGASQLYRIVLPQKLYTYTSMFRAYRREVLETIPITYPGFLGLVEILAEAMLLGYHVVEYPAEIGNRVFGQSKLRVARIILSHLQYISKLISRRLFESKNTQLVRYKYSSK